MTGRVLAVDLGEKRIGLAISDPLQISATPLSVFRHFGLDQDCKNILCAAEEQKAVKILIGQALGEEGEMTPQARHAVKVAEKLKTLTSIEVQLWDESGSTQRARQIGLVLAVRRKKRSGHLDDRAAAVFLQNYLDSKPGIGMTE